MTIKIRPDFELNRIRNSWTISDAGVFMWVSGFKTGKPVSVQTTKKGHQTCYLQVDGKLKGYSVGQVAWYLYYGKWATQEIDHIDCNPKNHKKDNLRLATRSEQCRNRVSGIAGRSNKGVYKRDYGNKWSAQIWVDGVCKNLGTYNSENEAIEVRQLATELLHKEFANTKSYRVGV